MWARNMLHVVSVENPAALSSAVRCGREAGLSFNEMGRITGLGWMELTRAFNE